MAYQTGTLTGTYQTVDGRPAKGTVVIIPNSRALVDSDADVILVGRITVPLDETGSFTAVLPATDDDTIQPAADRQYTVAARLRHTHLPAVPLALPAGQTVDMADATGAEAVAATYTSFLTADQWQTLGQRVDAAEQDVAAATDRANHVGTQPASTISDLEPALDPFMASRTDDAASAFRAALASAVGIFDVRTYGAIGDGATDARPAIQAAIAAAENAGGGRVVIPRGNYRLGSTGTAGVALKFTPDNTGTRGWTIVEFAPGAKLTLTANCRRAFDFARVADYDWFRKVAIIRPTIDCGGALKPDGDGEAVIGSFVNGVHQQRVNFEDMLIYEPHIYNLATQFPARGRWHIWFDTFEPGPYPGPTTCYLRRITIIRPRLYGGDAGIDVAPTPSGASTPTGTNAYTEDVLIEDPIVELNNGAPPATALTQTGILVGGSGTGRNVKILRPAVKFSGDVGIEVNGLEDCLIDTPHTEDCKIGIYLANYHPADDVARQTTRVLNPTHKVTPAWQAGYSNGIRFGNANPYGRIVIRNQDYRADGQTFSTWGTMSGMALLILGAVREVDIDGVDARCTNLTMDSAATMPLAAVDLALTTVGARIKYRNAHAYIAYNRTGAGSANLRLHTIRATDAILQLGPGITGHADGTGLTNFTQHFLALGESTAGIATSQFRGYVCGLVPGTFTGDSTPAGLRFFAGASAGSIIRGTGLPVFGCDFSAMVGATAAQDVRWADTATKAKLKLSGNVYRGVTDHPYEATVTWNPPSVASGASTSTTVTLAGAAVGDTVVASFSIAVPAGLILSAAVTAADTVTVTLANLSGAAVDLASGAVKVQRLANLV
jgi:hypothetical protein